MRPVTLGKEGMDDRERGSKGVRAVLHIGELRVTLEAVLQKLVDYNV